MFTITEKTADSKSTASGMAVETGTCHTVNENALSVFYFTPSSKIRVIIKDNEPWFCIRDVYSALGIQSWYGLLKQLDTKGLSKIDTPTKGGQQQIIYVNEPNLYRVVFSSDKPNARRFQNWVFDEVLPSIRKTGRYERKPTEERLSHTDMINIRRLFWAVSDHFAVGQAWANALWNCLRAATGRKFPSPFYVSDLPAIEREIRRISSILKPFNRAMFEARETVLRRAITNREDADDVMRDIRKGMEERLNVKWEEDIFTEQYFRAMLLRLTDGIDATEFAESV